MRPVKDLSTRRKHWHETIYDNFHSLGVTGRICVTGLSVDLPMRSVQTTQNALPGKAGARYHSTHITAVSWQVGSGYTRSFGYGFPIVLGVAY